MAAPSHRQSFQHKCESGSFGSVLRANISLIVIGFSLTGSIGSAAAQYLPPQPPPVGYPPPVSYPSLASPPRYPGAYPPYSDQYEDPPRTAARRSYSLSRSFAF